MTQEEIQERNKQIALMLGWEEEEVGSWYTNKNFARIVIYSTYNNYPHVGLPFYRDWNWLMEAIQFLHKHFESKEWTWTSIERYPIYSDIEKVFVLVSDFAKHYNEGKL
jgi:hypothetical protein